MGISDNYVPVKESGNGVTVNFSGSWNVISASFIRVFWEDKTTGVQTQKTIGTDFTLVFNSSGFTVTFGGSSVPPSTVYVVIGREVSIDQSVPYKTSQGFQGAVEENSFDKLTAICQDLNDLISRTPKLSLGSTANITLGAPVVNSVLYWSDATTVSSSDVDITTFTEDVQTVIDAAAAAAASAASASSDASSADADATATAADRVQTGLDATATAADRVQTGLDRVQTGLDATATAADRVQTDLDATATAADRVQTGLDATATAADRVQTGLDAASSSNSKDLAAASAAAAASSAAEGLYNDVVSKSYANSPIVPLLAEDGTLFRVDTSGGNVVVNLSALSVYAEDMKFAFVKTTADANTITINRGGTDTINGATSLTLSTRYEVHVIVGDSATGTWVDCVQSTGIPDGSVTSAKLGGDITTAGKNIVTAADAAAQRTALGLGTAAVKNTGTSGDAVPLLNASNEYSGQQNFPANALSSSSGHISWNLATAQSAKYTATENTVLDNPTNMVDGGTYVLKHTQHASSPKTLTYGSAFKWPGGTAFTVSATNGAVDILTFVSDGTYMYGVGQNGFA